MRTTDLTDLTIAGIIQHIKKMEKKGYVLDQMIFSTVEDNPKVTKHLDKYYAPGMTIVDLQLMAEYLRVPLREFSVLLKRYVDEN